MPASIVPGVVVKFVSAQKIVLVACGVISPVLVTLRQLTAPGIGPLPVVPAYMPSAVPAYSRVSLSPANWCSGRTV